jgi:serine/threonine-protein kinase HipA
VSHRQLKLEVNDQLVGYLREENDLWQFEYAHDWMTSPTGFELSPVLSREKRIHIDGGSNRPV